MGACVIPLFDFNGSDIGVIDADGEPWSPAKDVCEALGINQQPRLGLRIL
ncbi:prophage antirepressor [Citreicella sp. SE45]|nr:prophage antirepressor [Citreicella sp. SE45]